MIFCEEFYREVNFFDKYILPYSLNISFNAYVFQNKISYFLLICFKRFSLKVLILLKKKRIWPYIIYAIEINKY